MTDKVRIRCWHEGKETKRELMVGDVAVCEMSFMETMQLAMQATSTLRYDGSEARAETKQHG